MSTNDVKDWPTPLRLNVAALELAPYLYYKVCEVYGGSLLWNSLSFEAQHIYVEAANRALKAFHPVRQPNPGPASALRLVSTREG